MKKFFIPVVTIAAMAFATAAFAQTKTGDSSKGKVLTDAKGMTLYTYDKDTAGMSNCTGDCAEYWPPVMADAMAKPTGDLTVIKRPDGTMQWADKGMPLYTFAKDKNPGDMMGDNMKGVWHVVKAE